jgi:chemotaxis protein CheD
LSSQRGSKEYWDQQIQSYVLPVSVGDFATTSRTDLAIVTLLGSCVAACLCDEEAGVGGLNHFLLPEEANQADSTASKSMRYGVNAMEQLINALLGMGASRARLKAKLFGGASVVSQASNGKIGSRNGEFAERFLQKEGIPVLAKDLGGSFARRIYFLPFGNRIKVQKIRGDSVDSLGRQEEQLKSKISSTNVSGGIELFG